MLGKLKRQFSIEPWVSPGFQVLKEYSEKVAAVIALEPELRRASCSQLQEKTSLLRRRVCAGVSPDVIAVEFFALVREVAHREVGMRPFDVQVIGGLGL